MRLRFIANSSINLTNLAQQIATIVIVIAGVYMISAGELTTGALIACTILTGRALAPMAQVSTLFTRYFQSVNALKSLNKIMQMDTDVNEHTKFLHRLLCQAILNLNMSVFNTQKKKLMQLITLILK